jgi:hypothetical protein
MDKQIKFYSSNKPLKKELVRFKITKRNDHDLQTFLYDYNIEGCMRYQDATKKKRIRNFNMFPINKELYGIAENVDGNIIGLSTAYNDPDSDEWKKLIETTYLNKKLESMFKMLSIKTKTEYKILWEKYMYSIDKKRIDTNSELNLYEYFKENFEEYFNETIIGYINIFYQKNERKVVTKLISEFKLVSNFSINTTKEIIEKSLKELNKKHIKILLSAPPSYIIESTSKNSSLDDHDKLINLIKKYSTEKKSIFQVIKRN